MQFTILLKKNLKWYKRNYKTSLCELILPLLFILLTIYLRSKITIITIPKLELPRIKFQTNSENWLKIPYKNEILPIILKNCNNEKKKGGRIALAPKNELTQELEKLLSFNKTEIIYFPSDSEITKYTQNADYTEKFKNGTRKQLCFAISFTNYNTTTLNFSYNLRYNISSNPSSSDHYKPSLPYKIPYKNDDLEELRRGVENGIWVLQFLIEGFILENYAGMKNVDFGLEKLVSDPYRRSEFKEGLGFASVLCFVLVMLFVYLRVIGFFVGEKEKGVVQYLENMGMERVFYFFSLFALEFGIHFFYGFLFCAFLKIGVFVRVEFFVVLFAYWVSLANVIAFAVFVACFFSNAKKGIIFGLVFFFVLFMMWFLKGSFEDGGKSVMIFLGLSPIASLSFLIDGFLILENSFIHYEFSDLYNETTKDFKGIWFFFINIFEFFFFFVLGFYFFHVVSIKDGLNYHPLFFLGYPKKKKYSKIEKENNENTILINNRNNKYFEKIDEKLKLYEKQNQTVTIKNLTKIYNKKKIAVKNLNVKFYKNQIFSLLGHNGAGKTTTISMLSGLLKKTSGEIKILGLDISKDHSEIKKIIGICPQNNPIIPYLTVYEHLVLYANLKNPNSNQDSKKKCEKNKNKETEIISEKNTNKNSKLKSEKITNNEIISEKNTNKNSELKSEKSSKINTNKNTNKNKKKTPKKSLQEIQITKILSDIDLLHKKNYLASHLSGGQKRKLCVAIAFTGNSQLILLDEPSSGLDSPSRKRLWRMIKTYKKNRIIILTTHNMTEADCLGDRIGIMNDGFLLTCGSSLFLKNVFGNGYVLSLVKNERFFDLQGFLRVLSGFCQGVRVLRDLGKEVRVLLPMDKRKCFGRVFDFLERRGKEFGVESFGVALESLEEVFMNVVDIVERDNEGVKNNYGNDYLEKNNFNKNISESILELNKKTEKSDSSKEILNKKEKINENKESILELNKSNEKSFSSQEKINTTEKINENKNIKENILELNKSNEKSFISKEKINENKNMKENILELNKSNEKSFTSKEKIKTTEKLQTIEKSNNSIKNPLKKKKYLKEYRIKNKKKLFLLQIKALIVKRLLYFSRDISSLLCELFLPILIIIIGLSLTKINFIKPPETLKFDPTQFPDDYKINTLKKNTENLTTSLLKYFAKKPFEITTAQTKQEFSKTLFKTRSNTQNYSYYLTNISKTNTTYTIFFNTTAPFAPSIAINQINQALLRKFSDKNTASISGNLKPLPHTKGIKTLEGTIDGFVATLLISIAFAFVPASVIVFIIREREVRAKHLQVVSGVSPFAYWISNFFVDFLKFLVPGFFMVFLFFLFDLQFFLEDGKIFMSFLLVFFFGFAFLPFMYFVSFFFRSPSKGQIFIFLTNFVFGIVLIITSVALRVIEDTRSLAVDYLDFVFRLIPFFSFAYGFINMSSDKIYKFLFKWEEDKGVFTTEIALWDLVFLIFTGFFYIFCLIVMEFSYKIFSKDRLKNPEKILKEIEREKKNLKIDSTVLKEEKLVENIKENDTENTVVVKNLIKSYNLKNFGLCGKKNESYKLAIKKISFCIKKGSIFGLLGTNGAGKSTTFKILTGEIYPSSGLTKIMNKKMPKNLSKIRNQIGYCPQTNALFANLTVTEHLQLYSSLKGISKKHKNPLIKKTLKKLKLTKYKKILTKNLSGGNKRKLSVAIAIIGKPPIIFLDEPSSGMDPESRFFLWKVIGEIGKESCVVLTSHLMEEVEAVAGKLAVLVEGWVVVVGSVGELKSKFGECFELEVNVCGLFDFGEGFEGFFVRGLENSNSFDNKKIDGFLKKGN